MSTILLEDLIDYLYNLLEQEEEPDLEQNPEEEQPEEEQPEQAPEESPIEEPEQPKQEPAKAVKAPRASKPAKVQATIEPEPLNREQLKYMLTNNKGRIVTVVYRKKDGSTRVINTRLGVKKNIKGVGLPYNPEDYGYIILWDLKKNNYRTVNLNTVDALKGGGKVYKIEENTDRFLLPFKSGGRSYTGEQAWIVWKKWADLNRRDDFLYKVLDTIKKQGYYTTPKQYQVLVKWFNKKR